MDLMGKYIYIYNVSIFARPGSTWPSRFISNMFMIYGKCQWFRKVLNQTRNRTAFYRHNIASAGFKDQTFPFWDDEKQCLHRLGTNPLTKQGTNSTHSLSSYENAAIHGIEP